MGRKSRVDFLAHPHTCSTLNGTLKEPLEALGSRTPDTSCLTESLGRVLHAAHTQQRGGGTKQVVIGVIKVLRRTHRKASPIGWALACHEFRYPVTW